MTLDGTESVLKINCSKNLLLVYKKTRLWKTKWITNSNIRLIGQQHVKNMKTVPYKKRSRNFGGLKREYL